ncbi:MAG: TlpA family protein disulfide reductase [Candidatus Eisenbacteria bacterium]|uniref:TlpA family protein disulfide reductase n=1 Tax=Eiseniibacteriota bacterium TaxID=2212470 RepID=A0A933SD03_UNCEI|nr:TlpA family protein disulfide reductase [Candidatus Eisenbacteria bacterium]
MTTRLICASLLTLSLGAGPVLAAGWNSPPPRPEAQATLPLVPLGTSGEYAWIEVGSSAPDFSYEALEGGSNRLHDLRAQGPVLIVIGATNEQLASLQREREELLGMGVVPVAVVDARARAVRRQIGKLGLTYPVIADTRRLIAAQFNALEPHSRAAMPAWFVVDRQGRVRDLNRFEWPARDWSAIASSALGLPREGESRPASAR